MNKIATMLLLFVASCGNPQDEVVEVVGNDGHAVVVKTYEDNRGNCANGGTIIETYLDLDDSLTVTDDDQLQSTNTICNGVKGNTGITGATGPTGSAGSTNATIATNTDNNVVVVADCGSSKKAIAGGGTCAASRTLKESCSSDSSGNCQTSSLGRYWAIRCSGASNGNTAYATCL